MSSLSIVYFTLDTIVIMECYATQSFLFLCSTLLLLPWIYCPACKPKVRGITISAVKTFCKEIFSFWEFFRSKHFFKNCGPYCIRIRLEVNKLMFLLCKISGDSVMQGKKSFFWVYSVDHL